MNRRPFVFQPFPIVTAFVLAIIHWYSPARGETTPASTKPNIVLILADDLGWTDLACYGSKFYETPHIDQLARDGMRFSQAYSACTVCSPTRAALLTGKYPARLHITDWIPGQMPENPRLIVPDWTKHLPLEEITIARALKEWGYATASIGKWHLGDEEYYPDRHGFDVNLAGTSAPQPPSYFSPYKIATLPEGPDGQYITDRLTDEAIRFIEANKEQPFFLYLPHFAVHLPLQGKESLVNKYRAKLKPGMPQNNAAYAAMIDSLDQSVGRIRDELKKLKIADRTLVVFTSDNGGRVPTTSNAPLRVGKASCYEGGTRVPLIIDWPGVTQPGSVCDTPVISMDLYPTIAEIAGAGGGGAAKNAVDGVDLTPLLRQSGKLARDELFWHYPHYQHYQQGGTTPYSAIRKGDFKLIEFLDDMRVELYNLRDDIGEQHNLAVKMPKKVNALRERLHVWRKEVGAQMPSRNPNYDPSKPEHTAPPKKNEQNRQPATGRQSTDGEPGSARWAIALHTGAGSTARDLKPEDREPFEQSLRAALTVGKDILAHGGTALDAVEKVVVVLEDDPRFNAGQGVVFTRAGEHELDASIMDGATLRCGAVGGVKSQKNPVKVARLVMERTPHILLSGEEADAFGAKNGCDQVTQDYFYTEKRFRQLQEALKKGGLPPLEKPAYPLKTPLQSSADPSSDDIRGTVGCVALDSHGNLAAATSTGGLTSKMPGRLGDTPIIGAGNYANNKSCAVSGTGKGEEFIRHSIASRIGLLMQERKVPVAEAVRICVHEVLQPGDGGVIAIDGKGEVSMQSNTSAMPRAMADSTGRFETAIWFDR